MAAELLGVGVVNTFVGRDPRKTRGRELAAIFSRSGRRWSRFAEEHGVRIGIENCPMFFTGDEWPGGKNLAHSPAVWRRMFAEIPSPSFGLNYDPSHLVWQQMDYLRPLAEFAARIFHVHLKDALVDRAAARRRGHSGHAAGVSHAPAARPRRDRLAAVSRRVEDRRATGAGLHRGRGPRLRRLAGNPPARPAAKRGISAAMPDGDRHRMIEPYGSVD